jgi:DNA repair photolyase
MVQITTCSRRPVLEPCGLKNLNYQIDPYVGCEHYCLYCYALKNAETDWTKEIRIHEDITSRLRTELSLAPPQTIYMGYNTDPYQPCEVELLQTRSILELLLEMGFSASFLTKSNVFERDMDILLQMDDARISISTAFNDDGVRSLFEANTTSTEARIAALAKMHKAGLKTSALICPIIPYITNAMELIDNLEPITDTIWIYGLNIQDRDGLNWKNVQGVLESEFADKQEEIEDAVFDKEHPYWANLRHKLEQRKNSWNVNLKIHV